MHLELPPSLVGTRGIVAVSGGADSVALLRLLAATSDQLVVAHLNHQLRGNASDGDAAFVERVARSSNLPFRTASIDVAGVVRRDGGNLEANARRLRYDWLLEVARDAQASWIATGHTADDQVETVLHRLIRGTGLHGLAGIRPVRPLADGITLVRPILHLHHSDLTAYLRSLPQDWREDESNGDRAFTRNRIRHELLPLLRTFNPKVDEAIARLAVLAGEAQVEHSTGAAAELLKMAERPIAGLNRIFDYELMHSATDATLRDLFRIVWAREGWPLQDMTFDHWKRLVEIARHGEPVACFPGGIVVRRKSRVIQVEPTQVPLGI